MADELTPEGSGDGSELLLYQTEDGQTRIQVRVLNETVWLSQAQMAELFQTTKQNISLHIKNVFEEGELMPESTVKEYLTVQIEGGRRVERPVLYYNLDVIISVGYRVRSHRGTQFRQWATQRLREYIIKGFVLDDERLNEPRGRQPDYFEELLIRIRAIRASERRFYQKITDIYATAIDYNKDSPTTKEFFATVQNKMHFAIHGRTAAEIIVERADASKPHMGMTTWKNAPKGRIKRDDAQIAKNYLSEDEIRSLNRIVDQYLTFAEDQAERRKTLTMAEWRSKLDAFLTVNDRDILKGLGKVSHDAMIETANAEFDKFDAKRKQIEATEPTSDFDKFVEDVKKLPKPPE